MKTKIEQNSVCHPQTVEIPQPLEVHPSVSELAARLLATVIERLMAKPDSFNQNSASISCESPCCILGHCAILIGASNVDESRPEFLGLNRVQFQKIFWPDQWPKQFRPANDNEWKGIPAATGIARIEHFLRTGE